RLRRGSGLLVVDDVRAHRRGYLVAATLIQPWRCSELRHDFARTDHVAQEQWHPLVMEEVLEATSLGGKVAPHCLFVDDLHIHRTLGDGCGKFRRAVLDGRA